MTDATKVSRKALKLAREIVSDPETRAKIKAALQAEGKPLSERLSNAAEGCLSLGYGRELYDLMQEAARAVRSESATKEAPCETCNDDPSVCATVPGLRHCEAAMREAQVSASRPTPGSMAERWPGERPKETDAEINAGALRSSTVAINAEALMEAKRYAEWPELQPSNRITLLIAKELVRLSTVSATAQPKLLPMPTKDEMLEGIGWVDQTELDAAMSAVKWYIDSCNLLNGLDRTSDSAKG
jgi:hypothetical protein